MSTDAKTHTIELLRKAYSMELETVANYLANSIHLDGVRAEEIKKSLAADIQEELAHATQLANRIKQLEGPIPGSKALQFDQSALQPPEDRTDVVGVIRGVLDAENAAITHYRKIIQHTDGDDFVTQDMCIALLAEEEAHRTQFRGFLREYEAVTGTLQTSA